MTARPLPADDLAPPQAGPVLRVPRGLAWAGLVAVFFAAIAPTLTELGFSGGLENLNIATALELRRDHAQTLAHTAEDGRSGWLVPTLEGEPRIKKPPLTAWITALAITDRTVRDLSAHEPATREAAWDRLAWQTRWPTLLAACLMLIATYELGRAVADPTTALVAAIACGTSVMFLRYARSAMIDIHLGLWVTLANVFLAHAVLNHRRWLGAIAGGACLGVVVLLKGPVGLVQTVLPVAVFVAARAWRARRDPRPPRDWRTWAGPIAVGVVITLAISLPWYVAVARAVPGATAEWFGEFGAQRGEKPDKIYTYANLFVLLVPWTVSFIGGIVSARGKAWLAVSLALVPVLVMTAYKDRKDRYLFPVLPACAVVSAGGVMTLARRRTWTALDKAAVGQHWFILVGAGVVLPAAAATVLGTHHLPTEDGGPWLARPWGAGLTVGLGLVIGAAMLVRKRWLEALLSATVAVMLVAQAAVIPGYARTEAGTSAMLPLARAVWRSAPDALMYNAHPRGKRADVSLSIYLNRITAWRSAEQLKQMSPGPRPAVAVLMEEKDDPAPPTPPSPAWEFVEKIRRDKDWWWAFALRPK